MPDWLTASLDWIRLHPGMAGLAICLVAFFEGLALIGILIPGIVILFGFGALVGLGVLDLAYVWFWCSVGAILGDGVSFFLGHHFKDHLREIWPFSRFEQLFRRGEAFFRRHGLKSVVIGRFVGPIRPIMPVIAGMMKMDLRRYIPANIIAGILWAPAYLLPGVVFGASLELAKAVAFRLALLLAVMATLIWTLVWLVSGAYRYLAPRTSRMLAYALAWSHRHPILGRLARTLVDPSRPESGTLAAFAVLLIFASWVVLSLIIAWSLSSGPLPVDQSIFTMMGHLRSPWADHLMIFFNGLGSLFVLLPAAASVLIWLLWRRRFLAAWHWAAAILVGFALTLTIGFALSVSADPAPMRFDPGPLPIMHAVMSVVVYGFFAILIARELPYRRRAWPYAVAAAIISCVGFARLYYGLHWLSELLVSIGFGLVWTVVIGIAYRRRNRRSFWTVPVAGMFFLIVGSASVFYTLRYGDDIITSLTPPMVTQSLDASTWWRNGWAPPSDDNNWRETLTRKGINVQYAGSLATLSAALEDGGWMAAPPAGMSAVLKMLQPKPTPESLPILASEFQGREETLLYHRWDEQSAVQLALHVWPSAVVLSDGQPLWVGIVAHHRLDTALYFFSYWDYGPPFGDAIEHMAKTLSAGFQLQRLERVLLVRPLPIDE